MRIFPDIGECPNSLENGSSDIIPTFRYLEQDVIPNLEKRIKDGDYALPVVYYNTTCCFANYLNKLVYYQNDVQSSIRQYLCLIGNVINCLTEFQSTKKMPDLYFEILEKDRIDNIPQETRDIICEALSQDPDALNSKIASYKELITNSKILEDKLIDRIYDISPRLHALKNAAKRYIESTSS